MVGELHDSEVQEAIVFPVDLGNVRLVDHQRLDDLDVRLVHGQLQRRPSVNVLDLSITIQFHEALDDLDLFPFHGPHQSRCALVI